VWVNLLLTVLSWGALCCRRVGSVNGDATWLIRGAPSVFPSVPRGWLGCALSELEQEGLEQERACSSRFGQLWIHLVYIKN
jgi:hypothetical protein